LFDGGARLITLWGTAGLGKTRLALEYAERATRRRWVCELAACVDEERACSVVASALGLDATGDNSRARLARWLGKAGPSLLVLDNLEQLGDPAIALVEAWLASARDLRILATSRTRLRVADEVAFELAPLSLEYRDDPAGSEAAQLLLSRMRTVLPDLVPSEAQAREIATIVESLEGIPLAIELAAARVDVLGLEGLRRRLPSRLDLLAEKRLGRTARQSTLRGAIEWSWNLLDEPSRSALAQCAVFREGFTLDAAERVIAVDRHPVLDLIEALRDSSMVRRTGANHLSPRFVLFESIAVFADERLGEMGLRDATEQRLIAWATELSLAWQGDRAKTPASIAALLPERENLLRAASLALVRGEPALGQALTILIAADLMLATHGSAVAHLDLLVRAVASIEAARAPVEPSIAALTVGALGRALLARGRHEEAMREGRKAIELARRSRDPLVIASSLVDLGVAHHQRRELSEARVRYDEARAIPGLATGVAGWRVEARALGNLGALHHDAGEFAPAALLYRQALERFRETGDTRLEGIFRTNLGVLAHEQHALTEAREHFADALSLLERAADDRYIAITRSNLGALEHEMGNLESARAHHEQALSRFERLGDVRSESLCRGRLSAVLSSMVHLDEAAVQLEIGETLLRGSGDRVASITLRVYGAFLRVAQARRARSAGELDRAALLLSSARLVIDDATAPGPAGEPSVAQVSDDVRTAIRILSPALSEGPTSRPSFAASALVVAADGQWFRPPEGTWHDLRQRTVARALLGVLVDRHRKGTVDLDTLRQIAWPGEKMTASAAANRIHVALAELRKRGLKGLLQRSGNGYEIDAGLEIQRVAASWDEVQGPT
jgi:predicted ATPase